MKIAIFGLTISSSWGNGHATLWRALCRSLGERGHQIVFFERDVPYYADHRDPIRIRGLELVLYSEWNEALSSARRHLADSDVAIITSYCPDAVEAARLVLNLKARSVYYDMDTPITLEKLANGERVPYLPQGGLAGFDLVLSYTGGRALDALRNRLGARRVAPLYGSVDVKAYRRAEVDPAYAADLSYIGTYAADRQPALEAFFLEPARLLPDRKFLLAGSQYPADFAWRENIYYLRHLPPTGHPAFYSSSSLTLNITRKAMAKLGYCPSGRLFEAAACGAPIVSDSWEGIDEFFAPGHELLIARNTEDVLRAMRMPAEELREIASAGRARVLASHTSEHRASELERLLERPRIELRERTIWGIVPAAGIGSRIQPLAFSKELLPVGSRIDQGVERPRAVSEFLMERMVDSGATRICLVISPGKSDILEYYGGKYGNAHLCYTVQPKPAGLCDSLFRAAPFIRENDVVMIGLPDTIWFPKNGFSSLDTDTLSFLLFPVDKPQFFDAVVMNEQGEIREIQVKKPNPGSSWIWGAFKMPGRTFHELHELWKSREPRDEYMGTLINEYLARGGRARGVPAGEIYVDVGTLNGYREALQVLLSTNRYAA